MRKTSDLRALPGEDETARPSETHFKFAPQADLAAVIEDLPITMGYMDGDDEQQGHIQPLLSKSQVLAALHSTPVPASGLPSRDALVALLRTLAARWWTAPGMTDMADFPYAEEFADAILAALPGEETTP